MAFNYGAGEIVTAVQPHRGARRPGGVHRRALISRSLYTAGLPSPDLIIVRTAGEMRLSNFLLWQAYAEYYSTPVYWPDFDEHELRRALDAYAGRDRRFGRVPVPAETTTIVEGPPR